jgi:hypothetical protein
MPQTKVADLASAVQAEYEKEYLLHAIDNPGTWAQFIDWGKPVPEDGGGGSTFVKVVFGEFDPAESALPETGDPDAEVLHDDSITVTPAEWGKRFSISKLARYQSIIDLPKVMGPLVSRNRINSIDRVLRRTICGYGATYPTNLYHVDGSAAMSDMTSTDVVSYAYLQYLAGQAYSLGIEPFSDGTFRSIISPFLALEIQNLTEYKTVGYYQDKENIYGSQSRPFSIAGITFVPSRFGRTYLGAGTALQAATTLNGAKSAGATSITVTDATGFGVGNVLTLGTLETGSVSPGSNLENVLITAETSTYVRAIRGMGKGEGFGLRFDHATGESVVEAYDVAAIPLIGKNSIIGRYGADTGKYGIPIVRGLTRATARDFLGREAEWGWYWYGGVGVVQKNMLLGKVALTAANKMLGYN